MRCSIPCTIFFVCLLGLFFTPTPTNADLPGAAPGMRAAAEALRFAAFEFGFEAQPITVDAQKAGDLLGFFSTPTEAAQQAKFFGDFSKAAADAAAHTSTTSGAAAAPHAPPLDVGIRQVGEAVSKAMKVVDEGIRVYGPAFLATASLLYSAGSLAWTCHDIVMVKPGVYAANMNKLTSQAMQKLTFLQHIHAQQSPLMDANKLLFEGSELCFDVQVCHGDLVREARFVATTAAQQAAATFTTTCAAGAVTGIWFAPVVPFTLCSLAAVMNGISYWQGLSWAEQMEAAVNAKFARVLRNCSAPKN